jgi:thiamine-phosphate pyrophosphorylase
MIRYAITSGTYAGQTPALVSLARRWAEAGIDYVQLREKHMPASELVEAAKAMLQVFQSAGGRTKLLINARPDIALAAGAAGVHLTARPGELTPEQVRSIFTSAGASRPIVSVSCHTLADVNKARNATVDLTLFGPVFEKRVAELLISPGKGLEKLRRACAAAGTIPVLALGGMTQEHIPGCIQSGAAGIAGIRYFAIANGPGLLPA